MKSQDGFTAGEAEWLKCRAPFFPRRTVDGNWTSVFGQTWRRKTASGWEYKQGPETDEDWEIRNTTGF